MKSQKKTKYKQFILVPKSYLNPSQEASKLTTDMGEICSNDKRRINQMSKFKALHKFQKPLQCLTPESFLDYVNGVIPQDHLCRLVKEIVWALDTVSLEDKYSFLGQRTYHPKLLLSLLFYGYATGTRSSRKLEEKCLSDHNYIFLMQCYNPDHRTISDFRKNSLKEIESYFVEIVRIFQKLGFSNVGKIYIDGTKIKGNASAKRTKDSDGLSKWLENIEEEISDLLKEAEAIDEEEEKRCKSEESEELLKKKLSKRKYLKSKIKAALEVMEEENLTKLNLTDQDANHMKAGGSKDIRPGYNCQSSVTEDGVIVAAEASTDPNDCNQLKPIIEKSKSNTQEAVKEAIADSGYGNYTNYEYLDEQNIDGYVPDRFFHQYKTGEYEKEKNRYHYTNFKYNSSTESYICPEGKRLEYWKTRKNKSKTRQWNHKVYKGTECASCTKRALCTKSKERELLIDIREPLLQEMRKKLMTEEGKSKYFKRQYTIEPIFGHIKFNIGYRSFLLRGKEKVNGEFKLMSIGWNLKKLLQMKAKAA